MKRIHFLGIGGSGVAAVAEIAAQSGYEVSGCDINEETAYSDKLEKFGIKTFIGHSTKHLENVDLLVVTPAILFMNQDNEEVVAAKSKIPTLTWQEFLGKYLHKGKKVICVAGTHGKSTTTALLSMVLEEAGIDPSAIVGANVKEWGANSKKGQGEFFITEADEFNDNFLHYHPEIIILNNIEFDHPDFFKSEEQLMTSFEKFIGNLTVEKVLIVNKDSEGIKYLLSRLGDKLSSIKLIQYSLDGVKIEKTENGTTFELEGETYSLKIPGTHNVSNALGIIAVSKHLGIDKNVVNKVFGEFEGVGRRLELLGEKNGVKVYDDYAHHPTAIKATISALKQKFPKARIWAVIEAHGFARTKALLSQYKGAFEDAGKVVIGPIFKARDAENFGVNEASIVDASGHENVISVTNFSGVLNEIKEVKPGDVILVMGAGESYKWARRILDSL